MGNTKEENIDRIRFGLFQNSLELESYLIQKANNHKNYKYYSSKKAIQSICDNHSILLSDGSDWNDRNDRDRMKLHGGMRYFGFCFSFSASENVAMWMLYSQDNGCMIDFDNDAIKEITNPYEVKIGELTANGFVPIDTLNVKESGIRITLSDILYVGRTKDTKDNERFCYARRSGETNNLFDRNLIGGDFMFQKGMPWLYENECRLIVSVPEDMLSHPKRTFRLQISFDETHIKRLYDKKRIFNSPNVKHITNDDFYRKNTDSRLTNEISWNLRSQFCSNCINKE